MGAEGEGVRGYKTMYIDELYGLCSSTDVIRKTQSTRMSLVGRVG
jgi:hypothetical protein